MPFPEPAPPPAGVTGPPQSGTGTSPGDESVPGEGFRLLGERERFAGGFLRLVTGTFVGPDGFTFERDIVRHPGAVCVVPLEDDGVHVMLVRQYRAAIGEALLELPAGKLDVAGEPPEDCARRELIEEIGSDTRSLVELGWFYNSPGFTDERTWCFLAEGLIADRRSAQGVEERHMTIERVRLGDVDGLVAAGQLIDAKSLIGLFLARSLLASRARP
jgi:8-oxo-dGTP pyrophosphatase MutT (NUDIX family)